MAKIVKHMNKRTYTTGCGSHVVFAAPISAISKTVDFMSAEPVGSAFLFMDSIAPAGLQNDVDITVTLEAKPIGANCTFIS
ncbi:MAG: hypothetical protein MJY87_06410 [Fibrobacter sp.]|nr:hypothetical protein [Fibrobacter sp.]